MHWNGWTACSTGSYRELELQTVQMWVTGGWAWGRALVGNKWVWYICGGGRGVQTVCAETGRMQSQETRKEGGCRWVTAQTGLTSLGE